MPTTRQTPPAAPPQGRPPLFRHPGRVAIVVVALLLVLNLGVILLVNADTGDSDAESLPSEVQGATPDPGSVALPQDVVSVDLRDDLTGELWIDGLPIPDDQLEPIQQGILTFRPGEGQEVGRFEAGEHTVVVRCWSAVEDRPENPRSCFSYRFQTKA